MILIDLPWEGLNDLKLAVGIIEAQIFVCQRTHEIIEHGDGVRLQEPPIEALTGALRPEAHLGDVWPAGSWFLGHLSDKSGRPLLPLELDGASELLLLLSPLFFLLLQSLFLALPLFLFLFFDGSLLVTEHGFLVFALLALSEQSVRVLSSILLLWLIIVVEIMGVVLVHTSTLWCEWQYSSILKHFLLQVTGVFFSQDGEKIEAFG